MRNYLGLAFLIVMTLSPDPALGWSWYWNHWMASIEDDAPIKNLAIPGTHDSMSNKGIVGKTQEWDITTQLNKGIRFFDIRLHHLGGEYGDLDGQLWTAHGFVNLYEFWEYTLKPMIDFLHAHPSEVIFMSVKDERPSFKKLRFRAEYLHNANASSTYRGRELMHWFWHAPVKPDTKLRDLRARIVIYDRAGVRQDQHGFWDNSDVQVQDYFELESRWMGWYWDEDYGKKWDQINQHLEDAKTDTESIYVNYASANKNGLHVRENAERQNYRVRDFFNNDTHKEAWGSIVLMDFPKQDEIIAVIAHSIKWYGRDPHSSH